jgi:regulator of replication initiation timing
MNPEDAIEALCCVRELEQTFKDLLDERNDLSYKVERLHTDLEMQTLENAILRRELQEAMVRLNEK